MSISSTSPLPSWKTVGSAMIAGGGLTLLALKITNCWQMSQLNTELAHTHIALEQANADIKNLTIDNASQDSQLKLAQQDLGIEKAASAKLRTQISQLNDRLATVQPSDQLYERAVQWREKVDKAGDFPLDAVVDPLQKEQHEMLGLWLRLHGQHVRTFYLLSTDPHIPGMPELPSSEEIFQRNKVFTTPLSPTNLS